MSVSASPSFDARQFENSITVTMNPVMADNIQKFIRSKNPSEVPSALWAMAEKLETCHNRALKYADGKLTRS